MKRKYTILLAFLMFLFLSCTSTEVYHNVKTLPTYLEYRILNSDSGFIIKTRIDTVLYDGYKSNIFYNRVFLTYEALCRNGKLFVLIDTNNRSGNEFSIIDDQMYYGIRKHSNITYFDNGVILSEIREKGLTVFDTQYDTRLHYFPTRLLGFRNVAFIFEFLSTDKNIDIEKARQFLTDSILFYNTDYGRKFYINEINNK